MQSQEPTTRRGFLQSTTATAGALAVPYFVSARALGAEGGTPASDRIVMGAIGTGGMGRGNVGGFMFEPDVQMVAVCDVDRRHLELAAQMVNEKYENEDCQTFADYRQLVARNDLDAVIVATPDHWHALATIAALEQGKHVYCEKPLANSVAESRAIVAAVERTGKTLQCGSHERSNDDVRRACELVRNGRLGKVHTVRINMPCDEPHHLTAKSTSGAVSAMPVPPEFNYKMWLGHTPDVPYHESRCHFWWRFNLAYGGGEMTDRGAHIIDIGQLALDKEQTGPVEYRAKGFANPGGLYDAYMDFQFENIYADGTRMIGSNNGPRGIQFEGSDGWLLVHIHGGKLEAGPASILQETIGENEVQLGGTPRHRRNFLDCIKSNETPFASAEVAHRTASICHLNNIAMRLGRPVKWDPMSEQVADDPEATALLEPEMRAPWTL